MEQRKLNEIKYIVLHCSDSDLKKHDNIQSITGWHLLNGWDDIGYNYVICQDGDKYYGRSLFNVGAHAIGYNRNSISICLTGRYKFSIQQELSLHTLIMEILEEHKIDKIIYHNKVNKNKTCPNFKWDWIYRINATLT